MALVLKDRVLETSQTSGTGTISLAGAVNNFQSFSSAIGNGNTTYYAIVDDADSQWEVGLGTVGAGTLARTTVYASSNSGSLVNFNNSIKQVFCDYPASKGVYLDASGNVSSLGTITSGVWNGSTIPVANGGTGVTTSSGANSVVLRDANANITTNCLFEGFSTQAASGTTIVLTASSVQNWQITGSGGQTIRLPDATTLPNGATFTFNNNQSSGTIVVQNNSSTTVSTINSGGYVTVVLLSNSIAAGSWDKHDSTPSNVSWSTNTLDYAGSITSATWNGNTVQVNRGGTGATTLTGYVKGSGTSALTASSTIPSTDISGLGTMSTQNANAVAITGGTIDNTVIGGTTPAAGTFTTITGQTEVLKGTGQNLVTYSQNLLGANWVLTATTVSGTLYSAPDSTTTANDTLETSATSGHYDAIGFSAVSGITYTYSVYLKKGIGATAPDWIQLTLGLNAFPTNYANFNLNTGAVGTISGFTSTSITSAGSGWYRCSVVITSNASASSTAIIAFTNNNNTLGRLPSYAGATTSDVLVWGAQVEIGSVVNTYVPTTTTAVYGTPTLSFSGVAGLGLQSDGSLYVSPAGTGALQAQATTSSTAGGNARGANAVDWQTSRSNATEVASSQYSGISSGRNNTASAFNANISGGGFNTVSGNNNFIGGGQSNTANGNFLQTSSGIVAGQANTANGFYNFIGGGFTNSGTVNSAVTTQSGTMNATTTVTLSGSNASIKVGQYISGTSIAANTYVAAISGTSLTLSQNASGSSTSTLSFYTPHGVVVGGGNNQATGAYSFVGAGGDAGTAANRNVASGDWSFVGGGINNRATGAGSVVVGGGTDGTNIGGNLASGIYSAIVGGYNHTASNTGAFIGNGYNHAANAGYSAIINGTRGNTRSVSGYVAFPAVEPIATTSGCTQAGLLILGVQTTDATATILRSTTAAASGTNQVILPNNSAYYFKGEVISGVTGGGDTKGWEISGVIKRGAGVGTTTLVGSTVSSLYADAGAATWTIALAADTTNGGLKVTFTGQASTTIRTVCQIRTTEMTD